MNRRVMNWLVVDSLMMDRHVMDRLMVDGHVVNRPMMGSLVMSNGKRLMMVIVVRDHVMRGDRLMMLGFFRSFKHRCEMSAVVSY